MARRIARPGRVVLADSTFTSYHDCIFLRMICACDGVHRPRFHGPADSPQPAALGLWTAMIFGYNTNGFAHHRLADALMVLAQLGYGSIAITVDHDFLDPFAIDIAKRITRVKSLLQRFKLRCVVETGARFILDPLRKHQPTLVSPKPEERRQRLDFLIQAIAMAREFEADALSFWSGTPTD